MTPEEAFREWEQNEVTRLIKEEYKLRKELLKETRNALADNDTVEQIGTQYMILTSQIEMIDDFLNIQFEEIEEEEDDV